MSRGYTGWTQITADDQVLDTIIRRGYNALSQLLVTQYITIIIKPVYNPAVSIDATRFQRVGQPKVVTVFSPITTESTVIGYIETIGKYTSRELNEYNEVSSVTYAGDGTSFVNNITIPIATLDGIYIVGDIV